VVNESMTRVRLTDIVGVKEEEVARLARAAREVRARAEDAAPPLGFRAALTVPTEVRLLAEIKRRSPSAGPIREGADVVEVAEAYVEGGAAAISVLTDETFFGGSLQALQEARAAVTVPLLRKDFMIAPVQIWEARAAGADAILLIVRILDDSRLGDLQSLAWELGMDVLVEVHDRWELDRAYRIEAPLIGVNNRDLDTLKTDLSLSESLAPHVSSGVTLVAESGIKTVDDVKRLGGLGVDAILVGESLMREKDIVRAAACLSGHPRDPSIRRP